MGAASARRQAPVLLCYDGSDSAGHAIERAGAALCGGPAIVLTVWESLGSAILRKLPSGKTEFGRDAKEVVEDVVAELDADANPATARDAGVLGMPTLSLYVGGRVVTQVVGARPKASLLRALDEHLPLPAA